MSWFYSGLAALVVVHLLGFFVYAAYYDKAGHCGEDNYKTFNFSLCMERGSAGFWEGALLIHQIERVLP